MIVSPNRHVQSFDGSGISFAVYYMVGLASFGTMSSMLSCGGRIAAVRTAAGSLAADNFVAALASYTPIVLRSVGIRVPIYPVKGVTITVPAAPWAERTQMPIIDDGRLFGLVPNRMRFPRSDVLPLRLATRTGNESPHMKRSLP